MAEITKHIADRIVKRLERDGFGLTADDVFDYAKHGSVDPGVISEEHDAALESAILQQLDEYGIEV